MSNVLNYLKAIVAVIGAVATALLTALPDNETVQTWGPIVSAFVTAIAVYVVPNIPGNDTVATDDGVGPGVGA
jgi:hypothetical protein